MFSDIFSLSLPYITSCSSINNAQTGFYIFGYLNILTSCKTFNNNGYGFNILSSNIITSCISNNNSNNGLIVNGSDNLFESFSAYNSSQYGVNNTSINKFTNLITSDNSISGLFSSALLLCRNSSISEATEFTGSQWSQGVLWSFDHDQTDGNHWGFFYGGTFNIQSTTVHDTEPSSWKTAITSADRKSNYKAILPVGEFAGAASTNLVVTAWVKKDHATNIACRLVCYADDALGISEVSDTKADDTDWEQLSITLNSAHANPVFKVYLETWYEAGNSNSYLGAIEVS